ncbi:nitroreductase family protein [Chloroflexota bacterium]
MQVIKERRSIRKYRSEAVEEEVFNTILEAARWSPSWANTQCWRLIIVRTYRRITPFTALLRR